MHGSDSVSVEERSINTHLHGNNDTALKYVVVCNLTLIFSDGLVVLRTECHPTLLECGGQSQLPQLWLHGVRELFQGSFVKCYGHLCLITCPRKIFLLKVIEIPNETRWKTQMRPMTNGFNIMDMDVRVQFNEVLVFCLACMSHTT